MMAAVLYLKIEKKKYLKNQIEKIDLIVHGWELMSNNKNLKNNILVYGHIQIQIQMVYYLIIQDDSISFLEMWISYIAFCLFVVIPTFRLLSLSS